MEGLNRGQTGSGAGRVSSLGERVFTGLVEVRGSPVPQLRPPRVVRTQLELLLLPPGRLLLERVQHTFVEGATTLAQEALVGGFQRPSVAEGELRIREERPLLAKLGCFPTSELT